MSKKLSLSKGCGYIRDLTNEHVLKTLFCRFFYLDKASKHRLLWMYVDIFVQQCLMLYVIIYVLNADETFVKRLETSFQGHAACGWILNSRQFRSRFTFTMLLYKGLPSTAPKIYYEICVYATINIAVRDCIYCQRYSSSTHLLALEKRFT